MMKNNISILGCGWLGLPLGKFLAKNSKVKGSTTQAKKLGSIRLAGMSAYHLNLTEENTSTGDFFDADTIIITIPPSASHYLRVIKNTIAAIEVSPVKNVIFISSTAVYPNLNRALTENDAQHSASTRSGIKLLEVEDQFRNRKGFRTTVIRFAGLYGPGREPGRFLAGRKGIRGPGAPVNLVHLDDCIGVINAILERDVWGELFNVCAPNHPQKAAFYTKASKSLKLPPPEFVDEPAPFKTISSEKMVKMLDYKFLHPDPSDDF